MNLGFKVYCFMPGLFVAVQLVFSIWSQIVELAFRYIQMSSFVHCDHPHVHNHQQVHADVELFWYIMAEPETYLKRGTMDLLLSGLIFLPLGVIG